MPPKKPQTIPSQASGSLTYSPFAQLKPTAGLPQMKGAIAPAPAPTKPLPPVRPRVRLELSGRNGKVVTRVSGLPTPNLLAIAERLQKALGSHAFIEEADVLLQGSLDKRVLEWLERAGDLRSIAAAEPVQERAHEPAVADNVATDRSGTTRSHVQPGQRVGIVLKADQGTETITDGVVRELLTSSSFHPRGIKVRLDSGEVGRVKIIYSDAPKLR
ncbi:MAG TPA: YwbE family protein [Polyangiaceae bacterium]